MWASPVKRRRVASFGATTALQGLTTRKGLRRATSGSVELAGELVARKFPSVGPDQVLVVDMT